MSLFSELRRRNVFRVALLYVVFSWLLLEIFSFLADHMGMPGWVVRFCFALCIIGFPLALVFSWFYELTPEGLKREKLVAPESSITRQTGRRLLKLVGVCLMLILLVNLARFAF